MSMTASSVVALIKQTLLPYTNAKSAMSIRSTMRLYCEDAYGKYDSTYKNNLGLNKYNMKKFLVELSARLNIDLSNNAVEKRLIYYNVNRRFKDLVAFVLENCKSQNKLKEPTTVESKELDVEACYFVYVFNVEKDEHFYVCTNDKDDVYYMSKRFHNTTLFNLEEINKSFGENSINDNLGKDDVGLYLKEYISNKQENILIRVLKLDTTPLVNILYNKADPIDEILKKLSPEEAELVRKNLKER